jgi:hypothetical protein
MRLFILSIFLCIASVALAQSEKDRPKQKPPSDPPCCEPCRNQSCPPIPPISITVSPTQTLAGQPEAKGSREHKESEAERWIAIGTGILALGTLALAGVALVQRSDLDKASKRQLRAYVALDHLYFPIEEHAMQIGGPVRSLAKMLYVRVKNYGQTPSFDTSIWFQADTNRPTNLNVDAAGSGKQMLHPSMHYPMANPEPGSLGPYGQDGWVWGQVVYRDIFERWWRTNFLYRYQPPYGGKGEGTFTPENEHNEEKGPYKTEAEALA